MKSKILMGLVLGALISPCLLSGGNMAPEWLKKYELPEASRISRYKGASYTTIKGTPMFGNRIRRSNTREMYIITNSYTRDLEKGVVKGVRKIIITQKNPCFIIPRDPKKDYMDYSYLDKIENIEIKGKNKIVVYIQNGGNMPGLTARDRRDFKVRKRYFREVIPKTIDKTNSKIILGNSFECLKEPNEETWELFFKLKGKWVQMAEEKFYLY